MSIAEVWDAKFSRDGYLYGKEPNAFLASQTTLLAPKASILMLGEGEGRTAVYLSKLDFNVTALDASAVGIEKTQALANEMGVNITTILADLEQWQTQERYDAIFSSYLHLEDPLRTKAFRYAFSLLRPQGYFVAELFSLKQLSKESGGPKMATLLYTLESLEHIFKLDDATIVQLQETTTHLDEGSGHTGKADVMRLIIQKS